MAVNIGPKISVDGEAEYRAAMKNIIAQTKTLDSEMKLLVSTFDSSTTAEERNAKTSDVLRRKAEQQEKAVEALKKQLEQVEKAFGENSNETLSYQQRLNEMQAALNNTEAEMRALADGAEDTNEALDDGTDSADSLSNIFKGGLFAGIAKDMVAGLASKLKEFAQESIEAAATVKALDSSWSQTFGDMEGTANEVLDRVADSTGVMAERLKQAGQQIYAFNKASGADSVEALGTMERALTTAADLAAYYDKSVEEVTDTLLSFMKGNYANDAALGISSTEYTRNAAAVEMYGKNFNELTETMKQNVLLHTVEQAAELSGAMGQAAREADSWENVQGNLNEAWKQFEAAVGTPVLSLLIPVLQGITTAVQGITDALSPDEIEQATIAVEEFLEAMEASDLAFEKSSKDARTLADSIFSAASSVKKGTPEWDALRYKVQQLNQLYPDLNLQIDENTGALNMSADAVADFLDEADGYSDYARNQEKLADIEQQRADISRLLEEAERKLAETLEEVNAQTTEQGRSVAGLAYKAAADDVRSLKESMQQLDSEYSSLITSQEGLAASGYGLIESNDAQAVSLQEVSDSTLSYIDRLAEIESGYQEAYETALDSIKGQQGLWDDFNGESEKTVQDILANWQKQTQFSQTYAENMNAALKRPIDGMEELVRSIDDGSAESAGILDVLANGSEEDAQAIIDAFDQREEAQSAMANTMRGLEYSYDDMMQQLIEDAGEDWAEVVEILNNPDGFQTAAGESMAAYIEGLDMEIPALRSSAQTLKQAISDELANLEIPVKIKPQYDSSGVSRGNVTSTLTKQYSRSKVWAY